MQKQIIFLVALLLSINILAMQNSEQKLLSSANLVLSQKVCKTNIEEEIKWLDAMIWYHTSKSIEALRSRATDSPTVTIALQYFYNSINCNVSIPRRYLKCFESLELIDEQGRILEPVLKALKDHGY